MISTPALAADKSRELSEKQKIEALLRAVSGLKDARFIRKGTELDCVSAAEFLRAKYTYKSDEILTAEDFVRVCSASPDGEPYLFRLRGTTLPASTVLSLHLDTLS